MVPPEAIAPHRIAPNCSAQPDSTRRVSSWKISYSSIEVIVCVLDSLLILAASVAGGAIYSSLFHQTDVDLVRHIATAAIVGAVFVSLFRNRGLYDPSTLVNWNCQARNIVVLWTVTLLIFASATFALKIGPDFSRGAVFSFGIGGLAALLAHHALWRTIIETGLRNGTLRGRESILLCMHDLASGAGLAQGH